MPHGTNEAEDRHSNFYDARVNLSHLSLTDRAAFATIQLFALGDQQSTKPTSIHDHLVTDALGSRASAVFGKRS